MRSAYARVVQIPPGKTLMIAELRCELHNRRVNAANWARTALENLFSNRWPAIVGFCWWNEGWQNDDHKKHDTDMIILHDAGLTAAFRDQFAKYSSKIQ